MFYFLRETKVQYSVSVPAYILKSLLFSMYFWNSFFSFNCISTGNKLTFFKLFKSSRIIPKLNWNLPLFSIKNYKHISLHSECKLNEFDKLERKK